MMGSRQLLLMRHGDALSTPAVGDEERPLSRRGRIDAGTVAGRLRAAGLAVDLALCSTALRARQTLDELRPALGSAVIVEEEELYLAPHDLLLSRLGAVEDGTETILVIGHNPGIKQLAMTIADDDPSRWRLGAFPAAGLAVFELRTTWAALEEGSARLLDFMVPPGS